MFALYVSLLLVIYNLFMAAGGGNMICYNFFNVDRRVHLLVVGLKQRKIMVSESAGHCVLAIL